MLRSIMAAMLAGLLLIGWAMPSAAQQNGVVIENNGVSTSDSAAGADNVRISNNPGNGQSLSGGGLNNDSGTVVKERNRKDRGARKSAEAPPAEEYVAPAEEYAAPAEGDYQAYSDAGESVDAVAAPEQSVVEPMPEQQPVLKLPSTGVGIESSLPLAATIVAFATGLVGTIGLRRGRAN